MKARLMIAVSLLFVILSGCGGKSAVDTGQPGSGSNADDSEKTTLNLLIPNFYNEVEQQQWEADVEQFERMHPDIRIVLQNGDVTVESGKLTTLLNSGGTPPDAILMNGGSARVGVLSNAGLLRPLNDLYEKNDWKNKLRESAYDFISGHENIFEVPHNVDALQMFYHKDLFEQVGAKVPTTEAEFMEVLNQLRTAGIPPITVGVRSGFGMGWLFGGVLEAVAGKSKIYHTFYEDGDWSNPEFVKTLEVIRDWYEQGYIIKEATTLTVDDSKFIFLDKKAAMTMTGTYMISDLVDQQLDDTVGVFIIPPFSSNADSKTHPTGGIGFTWVIPRDVEDLNAAETWLEYTLSREHIELVLSSPEYNVVPAAKASEDFIPAGKVLAESMINSEHGTGYNPSLFIGPETKDTLYQFLQGLMTGQVTPEQMMSSMQKAAEADSKQGFKLK